jgi:peptidyl-prolyl cis-trans isomerase SurA
MPRIRVIATPFKRRLAAAVLLVAAAAAAPAARAQVVVVANGSPITAYDIEQRTKLIESSEHKRPTRQDVIQQLIDDRLKIAKAKEYGLEVTDPQVEQAFNGMASSQHITPQQFVQFLQRGGISPDTVKARIRAEITWGQLVRGKFAASLQIGDSDVAKALGAHNEPTDIGYIYTLYPVIVVLPYGSDAAVVESKRREAEQLRSRFLNCKQGLDFARALRDVAVRSQITRSSADLPPALRDLLGSMEIGRLTSPEVTAEGIQMFAVCDKRASKSDSPAERKLRNTLFQKRYERESKRYLDELRKAAMIEYKDAKDAKAK